MITHHHICSENGNEIKLVDDRHDSGDFELQIGDGLERSYILIGLEDLRAALAPAGLSIIPTPP